jgi:uncharacterized protein (DUF2235 family)
MASLGKEPEGSRAGPNAGTSDCALRPGLAPLENLSRKLAGEWWRARAMMALLMDVFTSKRCCDGRGAAMAKNIVICCDGTGNQFGGCNSNVVKLYTALIINNEQVGYYHPGLGTMGAPNAQGRLAKAWSVVKGLAFGGGFMDNVEDAYRYLMSVYDDGDRVYLFGFSRGAYTVRALAAILHAYGLLCEGNESHIPYVLRMFTDDMREARRQKKPTLDVADAFKETFSHNITLRFVGLWDTVSSVGWIYEPVKLL